MSELFGPRKAAQVLAGEEVRHREDQRPFIEGAARTLAARRAVDAMGTEPALAFLDRAIFDEEAVWAAHLAKDWTRRHK